MRQQERGHDEEDLHHQRAVSHQHHVYTAADLEHMTRREIDKVYKLSVRVFVRLMRLVLRSHLFINSGVCEVGVRGDPADVLDDDDQHGEHAQPVEGGQVRAR